jgi:CP family cyanate transporter-like MFS transporter
VPIWRYPVTWAVCAVFTVNCIIGYSMFPWLPHILTDAGVSTTKAAMYLGVFAAGSLPGALLTPVLIARMKRLWLLPVIFFIGYAVSFTELMINPDKLTLLWILVSRIGDCFFPFVLTMINLRTSSTRGSIAMSGFIQPVAYAISCIGPLGFGALRALTGSYHASRAAILICLPIQLVAGIIVARARPVDA